MIMLNAPEMPKEKPSVAKLAIAWILGPPAVVVIVFIFVTALFTFAILFWRFFDWFAHWTGMLD